VSRPSGWASRTRTFADARAPLWSVLGFDLTKARMSDWVLARSQTGVFQLHLSTAHPALLLAEVRFPRPAVTTVFEADLSLAPYPDQPCQPAA
jgi:hypothetical protein